MIKGLVWKDLPRLKKTLARRREISGRSSYIFAIQWARISDGARQERARFHGAIGSDRAEAIAGQPVRIGDLR
jgi:hypothetical protein